MARRNAARQDDDQDFTRPGTARATGTIARIVKDKGFGFLSGSDGVERFFHRSAAPDFDTLTEGDAVTFVATTGAKGPRAESVQVT